MQRAEPRKGFGLLLQEYLKHVVSNTSISAYLSFGKNLIHFPYVIGLCYLSKKKHLLIDI